MNLPSAAAAAMPRWASRLILLRAVMGQVPICLASAISLEGDRAMILKMSRSVPSITIGLADTASSRPCAVRSQRPRASHFAPTQKPMSARLPKRVQQHDTELPINFDSTGTVAFGSGPARSRLTGADEDRILARLRALTIR